MKKGYCKPIETGPHNGACFFERENIISRADDVTTVHLWDGQNIVADAGADGEIRSRFLRGQNLICQQIGELRHYYLFNAHGDVVQRVWQDNGENHASPMYIYDAFGNQYKPDASGDPHEMDGDPNPFRLIGVIPPAWQRRRV